MLSVFIFYKEIKFHWASKGNEKFYTWSGNILFLPKQSMEGLFELDLYFYATFNLNSFSRLCNDLFWLVRVGVVKI